MSKKRIYSAAERNAYYMGLGVGIGRGRKVKTTLETMPAHLKDSFKNGLDRGISSPNKPVFKDKRR